MNAELVFYSFPRSRGRMPHWLLEELGVPYRLHWIDIYHDEQKTPAYLAINPMGKVPALVHGQAVVTETSAILMYLADAFPGAHLAPLLNDVQRATYLRYLFFLAANYDSAMYDVKSPRHNPLAVDALGYGSTADLVRMLDVMLSHGPYLLGEHFSAVDIYLCGHMQYSVMNGWLPPKPRYQEYLAQLEARPAYRRMAEQCDQQLQAYALPSLSFNAPD